MYRIVDERKKKESREWFFADVPRKFDAKHAFSFLFITRRAVQNIGLSRAEKAYFLITRVTKVHLNAGVKTAKTWQRDRSRLPVIPVN